MNQTRLLLLLLFAVFSFFRGCKLDGITITNPVRYPHGTPFMAIGLNLAVPSELDQDLSLAIGFEVAYSLPTADVEELTYPPIISKRSLRKQYVYKNLEERLEKHGFSGRACLLRAICESAEHSFERSTLLADIIHILLTPSSTNEKLRKEYTDAENYGSTRGDCRKFKKKCNTSLIDLISVLKESFVNETNKF